MTDRNFMRVEDVARELDVSKSYAYKIVQKLNQELEAKGYITISGRVNKQYFLERTCYGGSSEDNERKWYDVSLQGDFVNNTWHNFEKIESWTWIKSQAAFLNEL